MKVFTEFICFTGPDSKSPNSTASHVQHSPLTMKQVLQIIPVLNGYNKGILFSCWNVSSLESSQTLYQI